MCGRWPPHQNVVVAASDCEDDFLHQGHGSWSELKTDGAKSRTTGEENRLDGVKNVCAHGPVKVRYWQSLWQSVAHRLSPCNVSESELFCKWECGKWTCLYMFISKIILSQKGVRGEYKVVAIITGKGGKSRPEQIQMQISRHDKSWKS